jgi:hypothetical protein
MCCLTASGADRAELRSPACPPLAPDRRLSEASPRPSIPGRSLQRQAPAAPNARGRALAASRNGSCAAAGDRAACGRSQAASGALRASPARARACRCPRAPGVHQTAIRRVIGEQQHASVRPSGLRVGVAGTKSPVSRLWRKYNRGLNISHRLEHMPTPGGF